jgi:2'-5' RNA ligase
MNLHAAFVPPAGLRQELADLVRGLEPEVSDESSHRRGLFGRRTQPSAPAGGPGSGVQLNVEGADRMVLPVTDFGNLASGDARRVADALEAALAELPAPTVRVQGGAALVDEDDRCVWAEVVGDDDELDRLRAIAQRVVSAVEPLGLFRDRRQFRSRFPIATITDTTTVEHLEHVLAALTSYAGRPWTVDEVTLLQRGSGAWREVPIGP